MGGSGVRSGSAVGLNADILAGVSARLSGSIGVIGDVHAEDGRLAEALALLGAQGVTIICCVGDVADGRGSVARCCALLSSTAVITVRGNHERWLLADTMRDLPDAHRRAELAADALAFLEGLPATRAFSSSRGGVLLCHGLGHDDMASVGADDHGYAIETNDALQRLIADPATAIVINGHTHRAGVRHFDGLTVVNAGTLYREHDPGFIVMSFDSGEVTWTGLDDGRRLRLGTLR